MTVVNYVFGEGSTILIDLDWHLLIGKNIKIERCFADKIATPEWQAKLKEMIPSYGQSLTKDAALAQATRERTAEILKLKVA